VIGNAVEAIQATAADNQIKLVTSLPGGVLWTTGDAARLQQIVWNLLSNAIKYTPPGGQVTVDVLGGNDRAEIRVVDTGIGIRPEFLPDLFERFRQASALTTRRHGGLGLGLSIARHLAELHGGSIQAWSAGEGKGATFTVQLPLRRDEPAAALTDRMREIRDAERRAGEVSLEGLTILVVEDDQDARDLVQRLLESHRARVVAVASVPEALDRLQTERPDLIICDIGLPDIDGYELARRIRAVSGPLAHVPAIALTAFARFDDRTRALAAGFNAHLPKPVEPAELVITVGSFANLIGGRKP
jgi:CheY-like chemotaxis protein